MKFSSNIGKRACSFYWFGDACNCNDMGKMQAADEQQAEAADRAEHDKRKREAAEKARQEAAIATCVAKHE